MLISSKKDVHVGPGHGLPGVKHSFSTTLIQELANEYCVEFRAIFRMDMVSFEKLLGMVAPQICKKGHADKNKHIATRKLLVTLRYLAALSVPTTYGPTNEKAFFAKNFALVGSCDTRDGTLSANNVGSRVVG